RLTLQPTDPLVFRNAVRYLHATGEINQRMLSEGDRDLAGFSLGKIFFPHDPTLFTGRDVKPEGIFVLNHHAIGAEVDPAIVWIARDVHRTRADVAAAVQL